MPSQSQRVLILAHPRTRCNLFFRLLSSHPALTAVPRFRFLSAYFSGPEYQIPERSGRNIALPSEQTFQEAFDLFRKSIEDAEATGKISLAMEHPFHLIPHSTINQDAKFPSPRQGPVPRPVILFDGASSSENNPTYLPDAFLYGFTTIITIRHPARVLVSFIRAMHDSEIASSSLDEIGKAAFLHAMERVSRFKWERLVFDSSDGRGVRPIVIDGDRLAKDPEAQMKAVCEALGIDAGDGTITFTWDSSGSGSVTSDSAGVTENASKALFGNVNSSKGVVKDKRLDKPVDIADEKRQWEEEWDEELASRMEELVQRAMEDYEYLYRFVI
ncbi:hypothetical protein VNI00_003836 [Paramarasmius palmivorus]|uniref:Uncharacterized protein n=1 Tax=Paramarasmius palmivorus TaxID=297713 RepID=A0AAW0DKJ7_9AGAR